VPESLAGGLEKRDGIAWVGFGDEAEPVAIEAQRAIKILYAECDAADAGIHDGRGRIFNRESTRMNAKKEKFLQAPTGSWI
jgi:hypothetical protein